MTITALYTGLLALWFLVLSLRVIQGRIGKGNPSLGDGGNTAMLRRIRAHANFAEYVPLILIMIGFIEYAGMPKWLVHALGAALLLGRLLHGYAFSFTADHPLGRTGGILLTLLSLLVAAGACVFIGLRG